MAASPDFNPYAPGRDDPPPSDDARQAFRPASLGRRLMGALVDAVFNLFMLYMLRILINGGAVSFDAMFGPRAQEQNAGPNLLASMVPLVIMGALIARSGQSLGKIVARTCIVDQEGRRAGLYNGFIQRTLPFTAIALVPSLLLATGTAFKDLQPFTFVTSLVSLVDALMIFGADRRCLHDRIAGTFVADEGSEVREDAEPRKKKKKKKRKPAPAEAAPAEAAPEEADQGTDSSVT